METSAFSAYPRPKSSTETASRREASTRRKSGVSHGCSSTTPMQLKAMRRAKPCEPTPWSSMSSGSASWNWVKMRSATMCRTMRRRYTRSRSTRASPVSTGSCATTAGRVSGTFQAMSAAHRKVVPASARNSQNMYRDGTSPATKKPKASPRFTAQYTWPLARRRSGGGTTSARAALEAGKKSCPVAPPRKASTTSRSGFATSAMATTDRPPRTSPRSMVVRRPMRSVSAPPSGAASVPPIPHSPTTQPASPLVKPCSWRRYSARKTPTKLAMRLTSTPHQITQKTGDRPPTTAWSLALNARKGSTDTA